MNKDSQGLVLFLAHTEDKSIPDWQNTIGLDMDTQELYVTGSAFCENEWETMILATEQKIATLTYKNHGYVPISWAKEAFPEVKSEIELWEEKLKAVYRKMTNKQWSRNNGI